MVLDIDVQGAMQVQEKLGGDEPRAVLVFVLPPTPDVLKARLRARGREDEEKIQRRLREVEAELAYVRRYDYLIINDELEPAFAELRAIRQAEKRRLFRSKRGTSWKI